MNILPHIYMPLKWGFSLGGAVLSSLAMNIEQQQMRKGHIRTTVENKVKNQARTFTMVYETMFHNNHYAYILYEVLTNKC